MTKLKTTKTKMMKSSTKSIDPFTLSLIYIPKLQAQSQIHGTTSQTKSLAVDVFRNPQNTNYRLERFTQSTRLIDI